MVCITLLIAIGVLSGHDGILLTSGIAVVAALGGYQIAVGRIKKRENDIDGEENQD